MNLPEARPALLARAVLHYGDSTYPVTPNETLPLPAAFDFGNPEACARHILAVMSNASGGHTLRDCRVVLAHDSSAASIVANGAHVYYKVPDQRKLTLTEALARAAAQRLLQLGDVQTDQYGDGYTRAQWRDNIGPPLCDRPARFFNFVMPIDA